MSTSTMWNQLSMTVISAFVALGTINLSPANAITFNFQGEFEDGRTIEGSYGINEDIFEEVATTPPFSTDLDVVLDFFSLTVDGINIFNGVPEIARLNNNIVLNGNPLVFKDVYLSVPQLQFTLGLDVPAESCLVGECMGVVAYFKDIPTDSFPYADVIQKPVNDVESVPEPTAAIALGVIGTSMLIRKRKLSSSP